jgi:hypothetical protein
LRCLLGHRWEIRTITGAGALTAIPQCERCKKVDVDRLQQTVWNRRTRRRWHRSVKRVR